MWPGAAASAVGTAGAGCAGTAGRNQGYESRRRASRACTHACEPTIMHAYLQALACADPPPPEAPDSRYKGENLGAQCRDHGTSPHPALLRPCHTLTGDVGDVVRYVMTVTGNAAQNEIATATGIDQSSISRWQRGTNTPSACFKSQSFADRIPTTLPPRSQWRRCVERTPSSRSPLVTFCASPERCADQDRNGRPSSPSAAS